MAISVRLLLGFIILVVVVITAVAIVSISDTLNRDKLIDIGVQHATSLTQVSLAKIENFFNNPIYHHDTIQQLVKLPEFRLPSEDPSPTWYQRWFRICEIPLIHTNYSLTHVLFVMSDETVFRCKVFNQTRLINYAYSPKRSNNIRIEEHRDVPSQAIIPVAERTKYPFPKDTNASVFPVYQFVNKTNGNTPGTTISQGVATVAFPSVVVAPHVSPLHDDLGRYLGNLITAIPLTAVSAFLQEASDIAGMHSFLLDGGGIILGSSMSDFPAIDYQTYPANANRSLYPNNATCRVSPPTDTTGVYYTCRRRSHEYTAFPALGEAFSTFGPRSLTDPARDGDLKSGSTRYIVVMRHLPNIRASPRFDFTVFMFYPESFVLSEVSRVRLIIILTALGVAFLCCLVSIGVSSVSLSPLSVLAREMEQAAALKGLDDAELNESTFEAQGNSSSVAEIQQIQEAFFHLRQHLKHLKAFVPAALFLTLEQTPSQRTDDNGTLTLMTEVKEEDDQLQLESDDEGEVTKSPVPKPILEDEAMARVSLNPLESSNSPSSNNISLRSTDGLDMNLLTGTRNVFTSRPSTVLNVHLVFKGVSNHTGAEYNAISSILFDVMNVVVGAIDHNGGTVDAMGFPTTRVTFNAHMPCYNHQRQALKAALRLERDLSEIASRQPVSKFFAFVITIDTAVNAAVTLGTATMSSRVVVGDAVNHVDRLQSLAVAYFVGSNIIMTDRARQAMGRVKTIPIDVVRHNEENMILHAPVRNTHLTDEEKNLLKPYASAVLEVTSDVDRGAELLGKLPLPENSLMNFHVSRLLHGCAMMKQRGKNQYVRRPIEPWDPLGIPPRTTEAFLADFRHFSGTRGDGKEDAEEEEDNANVRALVTAQIEKKREAVEEQNNGFFSIFVSNDPDSSLTPSSSYSTSRDASLQSNRSLKNSKSMRELPTTIVDVNQTTWLRQGDPIGQGAFGQVFLGLSTTSGQPCAMKTTPLQTLSDPNEVVAEIEAIRELHHNNIVCYYSCAVLPHHLVIMMEYLPGGTLGDLMRNFGRLPEEMVRKYARDMLTGLVYLHSKGYIHADLKPENVLLSTEGACKLVDFGSALNAPKPIQNFADLRGTPRYLAPEVARGDSPSPKSDIFSFGIVLGWMLSGVHPWAAESVGLTAGSRKEAQFLERLAKDNTFRPVMDWTEFSPSARELVETSLESDPEKRPTAQQLLHSEFFQV